MPACRSCNYADLLKEGGTKTFKQTGGWLGITDKYWAAALIPDQKTPYDAKFSGTKGAREYFQTDFLMAGVTIPPGGQGSSTSNLFAGAKQVALHRGLSGEAAAPSNFDLLIDWGWFWFITKPLFKLLHWLSPGARQLRPRRPRHHRAREGGVLPAGQQELRVDGQDEEAAAGDGEDPRTLQGRSRQAAAGADGALQEREDQPDGGLPADRPADPGVLRALQGAVRHHRHAPGAVLRLDQGPVRARSDLALQPVRAAAVTLQLRCRTSCTSASGR